MTDINENENLKLENSSLNETKQSEIVAKNKPSISFFSLRVSFYLLIISIILYALIGNHDKGTRMAKIKKLYYDKIIFPSYNFVCDKKSAENSTYRVLMNSFCERYEKMFSLGTKGKTKKSNKKKNFNKKKTNQQQYKLKYKNKIVEHIAKQKTKNQHAEKPAYKKQKEMKTKSF
jgi:hypothetical protein